MPPLFSAFTPFGQLEFSSDDSDAQKAYNSLRASLKDPVTNTDVVDMTVGGAEEAQVYATAMALGAVRATIKRAAAQHDVTQVDELLVAQEARYRLVPPATATRDQRRATLAAKKLLNRGSREEAITNGLLAILGANFIKLRTMDYNAGDVALSPADPSTGPGIYPRPDQPARLLALVEPVTITGAPTTVYYQKVTIEEFEKAGHRNKVKILIGGAPTSQEWADSCGADGWGRDAVEAVRLALRLVKEKREAWA